MSFRVLFVIQCVHDTVVIGYITNQNHASVLAHCEKYVATCIARRSPMCGAPCQKSNTNNSKKAY